VLERWQRCVDQLEQEISPQLFRTWIRPLVYLGYEAANGTVRIGCPNAFKLNWVRQQWGHRLESMLRLDVPAHLPLNLQFEVSSHTAENNPADENPADDNPAEHYPADDNPAEHYPADHNPADHNRAGRNPVDHSSAELFPAQAGAEVNAGNAFAILAPSGAHRPADISPPSEAGLSTTTARRQQNSASSARQDPAPLHVPALPLRGVNTPAESRLPHHHQSHQVKSLSQGPKVRPDKAAPSARPHQAGALLDEWTQSSKLNRELSFENFVTGKSNQMARAAALQVSQRPGLEYNPLFIYGGVGLGKTHLMHAVGNALRDGSAEKSSQRPKVRVRYIHAQEFFDEMVRSIQRKNSDEMRAQYQKLDLFLIDDIQFLSNKPRTQEEFFYLFEALFAARKQIILTCDTYPKEMSGVEERLVSRFDSGLIVAIEPPDLETRTAILHRKAEMRQVHLPDDVAFFVAKNLRSNVRELEGALNRLVAASSFRASPICLELAREALQDLLDLNRPAISVETIQKTVADYYKLKIADMYSKRRPAHIALARQVAMYMAKELTQKSLPEIGELFGGRDHTTVLHAVRRIGERRLHETELNHAIKVLEQTLRS